VGVHPVRYCVAVNSVTLKILVSFIVSPIRYLSSNGVKKKVNHPPLAPPIVRLSSRRSQGRGISSRRRPNLMYRNFNPRLHEDESFIIPL